MAPEQAQWDPWSRLTQVDTGVGAPPSTVCSLLSFWEVATPLFQTRLYNLAPSQEASRLPSGPFWASPAWPAPRGPRGACPPTPFSRP